MDVLKMEVKIQAIYNTHPTEQDNESLTWFTAFSPVLLKFIPMIHLLL